MIAVLRAHGPHGRKALVDRLGVSIGAAQRALERLAAAQQVTSVGVRRGQRWHLVEARAADAGGVRPSVESDDTRAQAEAAGKAERLGHSLKRWKAKGVGETVASCGCGAYVVLSGGKASGSALRHECLLTRGATA